MMFSEHLRHISKSLQLPLYNSLSVRLPCQHPLCTFLPPCLPHALPIPLLVWSLQKYSILCTGDIIRLFIMLSLPVHCHLVPLQSIKSPSAPYPQTPSAYIPLNMTHQISHRNQTTYKTVVLNTLLFVFLDIKPEDKTFPTKM